MRRRLPPHPRPFPRRPLLLFHPPALVPGLALTTNSSTRGAVHVDQEILPCPDGFNRIKKHLPSTLDRCRATPGIAVATVTTVTTGTTVITVTVTTVATVTTVTAAFS